MLIIVVPREVRILTMSVSPECECRHEGVPPPAVVRKHTEIGDRDVCWKCACQLPGSKTILAYDAVDNPVTILPEGMA